MCARTDLLQRGGIVCEEKALQAHLLLSKNSTQQAHAAVAMP